MVIRWLFSGMGESFFKLKRTGLQGINALDITGDITYDPAFQLDAQKLCD